MPQKRPGRRRFLRAVGAAGVGGLAGVAGCIDGDDGGSGRDWVGDYTQFQYAPTRSGRGSAPGPDGPVEEHWRLADSMDVSQVEVVRAPVVVDGVAYVTLANGSNAERSTVLQAIDVESGDREWQRRFDVSSMVAEPTMPAYANGDVYFGASNTLFRIDAEDGDTVWSTGASFNSRTRPVVADGRILVEDNTYVRAIGAEDGEELWQFAATTEGRLVFTRPLAYDDGVVYVGSEIAETVDAETGEQLWGVETDSRVTINPTVGTDAVYVGTRGGRVYSVDRDGEGVNWDVSVTDDSDGVSRAMAVTDDTLLLEPETGGGVLALSTADGSRQWHADLDTDGPVAVSDGTVYARNHYTSWALDLESGDRLWQFSDPVRPGDPEPPVVAGHYAFQVLGTNDLVALRGES